MHTVHPRRGPRPRRLLPRSGEPGPGPGTVRHAREAVGQPGPCPAGLERHCGTRRFTPQVRAHRPRRHHRPAGRCGVDVRSGREHGSCAASASKPARSAGSLTDRVLPCTKRHATLPTRSDSASEMPSWTARSSRAVKTAQEQRYRSRPSRTAEQVGSFRFHTYRACTQVGS
jgi:hypothetical protein